MQIRPNGILGSYNTRSSYLEAIMKSLRQKKDKEA